MYKYKQIYALALVVLLVCACATPAYKDVFKDKPAYNAKSFTVNRDILYQAVQRAICARNFLIEKEDPEKGFILGKRSFQRGKRTIILLLQASINYDAVEKAMLYLNALETTERHYVSDRTRFLLWLIPLPGGGGKEGTSVKVGERVIEDETFYENFFVEIDAEVKNLCQAEMLSKKEQEAVVQGNVVQEMPVEEETLPLESNTTIGGNTTDLSESSIF